MLKFVVGIVILMVLLKLNSVTGYSCYICIRYCYNNYSYTTSLVFSQSRIAPIKTQTISRLELQATLLLAKSIKNIYESLIPIIPINLLCYWNDSTQRYPGLKTLLKNMNYILIVAFQKFVNFLTHYFGITLILEVIQQTFYLEDI